MSGNNPTNTIFNNLKNTDEKFKGKFDCLYKTWKTNELVEPCIKITDDKHNDKRVHHKMNWNLLSKNFNNSKVITPININRTTYLLKIWY